PRGRPRPGGGFLVRPSRLFDLAPGGPGVRVGAVWPGADGDSPTGTEDGNALPPKAHGRAVDCRERRRAARGHRARLVPRGIRKLPVLRAEAAKRPAVPTHHAAVHPRRANAARPRAKMAPRSEEHT